MSEEKYRITRAKLVAKQRVGLPLMSEVKLEVSVRSRALKPITKVTIIKNKKIELFLVRLNKIRMF